jgi:type IV fimbrial biogenesis protein FimT
MKTPLRKPPAMHAAQRGFTLVEALVVLALIAILLGFAAPNLASFQRGSQLRAAASSFLAALQVARAEAMKRGVDVYVTPAASNNWATGWVVFADADWDQTLDRSKDAVVLEVGAISARTAVAAGLTDASQFVDGAGRYIRFNGGGFPQTKAGAPSSGAIEFGIAGTTDLRRRVVLNTVGRARVCDPVRDTGIDCRQ